MNWHIPCLRRIYAGCWDSLQHPPHNPKRGTNSVFLTVSFHIPSVFYYNGIFILRVSLKHVSTSQKGSSDNTEHDVRCVMDFAFCLSNCQLFTCPNTAGTHSCHLSVTLVCSIWFMCSYLFILIPHNSNDTVARVADLIFYL